MQFQDIKNGRFYLGDCLEVMKEIPDGVIDMVLCDLPYGTTACSWDSIIPIEKLWEQYRRIVKDNGAIVLTASQPFSSLLVSSNFKMFKYEWVWDKKIPSGMSYAKTQPMRQHEAVLVFEKSGNKTVYNPQKTKRDKPIKSGGQKYSASAPINNRKGDSEFKTKTYEFKNPTTLLSFDKVRKGSIHPTQKPVALFEYLIKTYTNEGELVLDNTAGSGTTAIAAENTGRKWVCIEQNEEYATKAVERIQNHEATPQQASEVKIDSDIPIPEGEENGN